MFNQCRDFYLIFVYFSLKSFFQIKLLTTALSEKFEELKQTREELRQTKKEYELVMQERTTVHRELQEQTSEIDMLKGKLRLLQDQINFHSVTSVRPHERIYYFFL